MSDHTGKYQHVGSPFIDWLWFWWNSADSDGINQEQWNRAFGEVTGGEA